MEIWGFNLSIQSLVLSTYKKNNVYIEPLKLKNIKKSAKVSKNKPPILILISFFQEVQRYM